MQKPILFSLFILTLLVLGVIFLWWPKYQDYSNLKFDIAGKKAELQNKNEYFSQLSDLSLKLKEYGTELSKIDSALPLSPEVKDLLNFLGKTSSQNGLILEKVNLEKISPLEKNSKILKTSLTFSVTGYYPAFKNFLSGLEKSGRLIEVESVSFSSSKKEEAFPFDVKIKTYSY